MHHAIFASMISDEWRNRLKQAIARDGRSLRAISAASGNGQNFLQQVFKDEKDPGFSRMARVLDELGAGAMLYVISGNEMTNEDAEMLRIVLSLPRSVREEALDLFRAIQAREERPEPAPFEQG